MHFKNLLGSIFATVSRSSLWLRRGEPSGVPSAGGESMRIEVDRRDIRRRKDRMRGFILN
jgi:hypothetical protein